MQAELKLELHYLSDHKAVAETFSHRPRHDHNDPSYFVQASINKII